MGQRWVQRTSKSLLCDGTNIDVRDDINTKIDGKNVYSKANVTYENTSEPHPASAVKIRGPKSLAGFTA